MLTMLRRVPLRELLTAEAPSLVAALVIAELFYKFGSFTLECLAFLATWAVFGLMARVIAGIVGAVGSRAGHATPPREL